MRCCKSSPSTEKQGWCLRVDNLVALIAGVLGAIAVLAMWHGRWAGRLVVEPAAKTAVGLGSLEVSRSADAPEGLSGPGVQGSSAVLDVPGLAVSVASQLRSGRPIAIAWQRVLENAPLIEDGSGSRRRRPSKAALARSRVGGRACGVEVLASAAQAISNGIPSSVALDDAADALATGEGGRFGRGSAMRGDHRRRAAEEGRESVRGLRSLAAACRLAEYTGAPLAEVLEAAAASLDERRESDAACEAALAGPQSTARLLGWLPLAGLGLGQLMGADPIQVVCDGGLGSISGVAGISLMVIGRRWSARMVRSVAMGSM